VDNAVAHITSQDGIDNQTPPPEFDLDFDCDADEEVLRTPEKSEDEQVSGFIQTGIHSSPESENEQRREIKKLQKQLTSKRLSFVDVMTESPDKILYETDLFKYHAGQAAPLVERWCHVTTSAFRYFKNHWSSIGQAARHI
jgi:hypothetical protein